MIFVFGTLWFWLLITLAYILICISLEYPRYGGSGATLVFVATCAILWFFGGTTLRDIFSYINEHPWKSLLFLLEYFLVGVIWSFAKWYFFLLNRKEKIEKQIEAKQSYFDSIPSAKDYKGRIISWMTYWPMSIVWTFLNDPFKRIFKYIYSIFEKWYESMSNRMFADIRSKIDKK